MFKVIANVVAKSLKPAAVVIIAGLSAGLCLPANAQVSVTTWRNDNARTGQNLNETILTPTNVNPNQFGKLFSQAVDGYVYAQPLYVPNVVINGIAHNVVYVATEHDSVYAFDADSNSGTNASALWFASMLSTSHGAASGATTVSSNILGTDIVPEIGITGTPVIDTSTGTLFVVSKSQEGTSFVQRLHALDLSTGAEKFGGPVVITATVSGTGNGSSGGTLTFDSEWQNQRPGLMLQNGIVYVAFASHGDNGPWHGWILGYDAHTLKQTGVFCASPNGVGSGFWMSGAGLSGEIIDPVNHPYGRMFVATGNGDYTASSPYKAGMDFGDSVLNLDLTNGVPTIQDEFTPSGQAQLDAYDGDQGAAGILILPTQTTGSFPHLLVQAGKSGEVYLLNRENLGGYHSTDQVVQELPYTVGDVGTWTAPAYWNGTVYYWAQNDTLKAFSLSNGLLVTPPATSSESYGYPGANPSISANGNTNGIIWTINSQTYQNNGSAVLQAHDAINPGTTLYSSATNGSRDNPGGSVKFTVPTIANGKVYVGAETQISVYGLLSGLPLAASPTFSPGPKSFNGSLQVTISDTTPGATIYYTTDGSTPTTSSSVYSSAITISATTTVKAMASATGYLSSAVASATYTNSTQVIAPKFSPGGGTFTQPISVTISDGTTGATIYYTTDGSTPSTASAKYTGPVLISTTETLSAIAVESGYTNSPVVSAVYTINAGGTTYINYATNGFTATNLSLNNGPTISGGDLQLTDGGTGETRSAWFTTPVPVGSFVTNFSFQILNPSADGMTFTIQGNNIYSLGYAGGGLGYQSIGKSVAVKFDLFDDVGEGSDSTGLFTDGAAPTTPSIDLTPTGVDLHSGDIMNAQLVYDGSQLTLTLTDTVTNASASESFAIDIPGTVGGSTAYVGFTGGTGGLTATQNVRSWNYVSAAGTAAATPTFSPAAGSYTGAQTVTISDSTAGAVIYYTTDGSTPTTSSPVYSAPITVASSETVQAMAAAPGFTNSVVASAAYTITPGLPAPTFLPAAGTYTTTQYVAISDTTPGTTIYYTTDGSTPTTSSAVYTGPITVISTQTIQAIAVATGYSASPVGSAAYTMQTGISFTQGFAGSQGTMVLNGSAALDDSRLQLTNGGANESGTAWYYQPVNVQSFTTDFSFQLSNPAADGITFAIQGVGVNALGADGAGLGYQGIGNSVAVKFDFYNDAGEGSDSIGLYQNGAIPTVPAIDLSKSGIDLRSDDTLNIHLAYNGTVLSMSIYDIVTGNGYSTNWTVNIPALVGGNTAYFGFTGGTNAYSASQKILTWAYAPGSSASPLANSPGFAPPGGTYSSVPAVTLSDSTGGAVIYYTTDGSTPTTSSSKYSAPVTVSAGGTLKAMAVASGYTNSSVAIAKYTTGTALPAPTFTPAAGTYATAQSVSIADSVSGTTIYYTTDGSQPTTSSSVYLGPIPVNASQTVQAIAVETGYVNSPVGSASYTITMPTAETPTFSPGGGNYTSPQTVAIADNTPGAVIYYTTNGTTPTTSSAVYSGPITVSTSETLEAIASASGYTQSAVATAAYTITTAAATPTFSPAPGTYSGTQTVTISDSTAGAVINYTTNGTTPTTSSAKYAGPITVSSSETIQAIATATGYSQSAVGSAAYTIRSTPTVSVSPASSSISSTQSLAVTVTVSGGAGNPVATGSVTLTSGSYASAPASLSNGAATITIDAGTLAIGTDTITASYTPDSGSSGRYNQASNSASVTVTQTSYAITATPVTLSPGAAGSSTISVKTTNGYTGTVTLTCALASSPNGAVDLPTCTAGQTVTLSSSTSSGSSTVTIQTKAPGLLAKLEKPSTTKGIGGAAGGATLALLVLFGIPAQRRKWRSMLAVFIALVALAGLSACGGVTGTAQTKDPGTTPGTYTFTVTGTGNDAAKTTSSGSISLTVN